jgi:hypothetical protein
MKKLIKILIWSFILPLLITISCACDFEQKNTDNFDYENWPGKDGVIKHKIELPLVPFQGFELDLIPSYNDSVLFFNLPLSEKDTVKIGRLSMQIYPTVEKAQLALLDYLFTFQSSTKPDRLKEDVFPYCDIAFGWENEETFDVYYCNNNIMIIIEASNEKAKKLAEVIDDIIKTAPDLSSDDNRPAFIISEDFKNYFLVNG